MYIDLKFNIFNFGDYVCSEGVLAIAKALSHNNNTTLSKLLLPINIIDDTAMIAMGQMLKSNSTLTELNIAGCEIWTDGARSVADALKQNTTLLRLNVGGNEIGDDGVIAIVDAIKENYSSSLSVLDLSDNNIEIIGAISIATMLTTNKTLVALHLGRNEMIGKEGVIAIVEALTRNKLMTELGLEHIPFADDGARSIASLLTTNDAFKVLKLKDCSIGDAGAIAIAEVLKSNNSLESLSLDRNPFSCSVIINEFATMLEINTTLKKLDLGDHIEPIGTVVAVIILKTLEDYNDTAVVDVLGANSDISGILSKIRDIGEDNRKGIRVAPLKHRNIFNSLQLIWLYKNS